MDTERVIVDVGTGFFIEKSVKEARVFYEGKVKELQISLGELEKIVQGKSENLRVVEDGEFWPYSFSCFLSGHIYYIGMLTCALIVMRQKILEQNSQTGGAASASG